RLPPGKRRITSPFKRRPGKLEDHLLIEERPIEQIHLRLAFHAEGRKHAQMVPSRLLSVLLGETMSSRLSQELREKRGYCYSVGSSRDAFIETGLFSIYVSFEPRFLVPLLKQIFRQLQLLCERPPSARELKESYQYVAGSHDMGLEETTTQMFWLGDAAINRDDDLDPNRYIRDLAQVRPADIQQAAQDIFTEENLRVALLGPNLEKHRPTLLALCEDLI
ncbi:MAG: M16 family metallopeptidase, partial [Verrucomicrobiales bacterium]